MLEIVIKTKTGKSLPLEVEPDDTIEHVLLKIDAKDGANLPAGQRRLVHGHRVMERQATLKDYAVKSGDFCYLVVSPPQRIVQPLFTMLW